MTTRPPSKPTCPQCGHDLAHNDAGVWCTNFPCRYVINRTKAIAAARVVRAIWGPIR